MTTNTDKAERGSSYLRTHKRAVAQHIAFSMATPATAPAQRDTQHKPDYSLNDPNRFNRYPFVDKATEERCKTELVQALLEKGEEVVEASRGKYYSPLAGAIERLAAVLKSAKDTWSELEPTCDFCGGNHVEAHCSQTLNKKAKSK